MPYRTSGAIVASPPPAPKGLGAAGKALWRSITGRWDLDSRELAILAHAARTADLIADLEELLRDQGLVIVGSAGQPRLSPVPTEIRQQRATLERLLAALSLPVAEGESPRVSRRSELAARRRWDAV